MIGGILILASLEKPPNNQILILAKISTHMIVVFKVYSL